MGRIQLASGEQIVNVNTTTGSDTRADADYVAGLPFRSLAYAKYWAQHTLDSSSIPSPTKFVLKLADQQTFDFLHTSAHGGQTGACGALGLTIRGGVNSVIQGPSGQPAAVGVYYGEVLTLENVELRCDGGGNCLDCVDGANVHLDRVRFGSCLGGAHVNIIGPSTVQARGTLPCVIAGNARFHIAMQGGYFRRNSTPWSVEVNLTMDKFVDPVWAFLDFRGANVAMNGRSFTGVSYIPNGSCVQGQETFPKQGV